MFGGHVNKKTGGEVCTAEEECGRARRGAGDGEFDWVIT